MLNNVLLFAYRIEQNFRGRKYSRISRFWSHPRKFSPQNLGVPYQPMVGLVFYESFLREMVTSYQSVKVFSLESFLLYGISHPRCHTLEIMQPFGQLIFSCKYVLRQGAPIPCLVGNFGKH